MLCFYYGSVFNKFKKTQLFDLSDSLRIKCFFCLPNWTNSHNWVSISNLLSWVNLFLTRLLMLVSGINCSGMKSDVTNQDLKNKHDKTSKSQKWCSANRFVLQKQKKNQKNTQVWCLNFQLAGVRHNFT